MTQDLNDTLIFAKVVEHGSFIAAARALRLPKTTVSRRVQDLEARLGAQLLHRTTRRLGLTEAGNVYFEHSQRIARELEEAERAVGQLQDGPRGWLRVTAPYSVGIAWIAPLLGEFHSRHPEVRVEMMLTNESLDLIAGEIDVALRIGYLPDSNLVARRLGTFRTQLYASPAYVERHGEPQHPDELVAHRTLSYDKFRRNDGHYWPLHDGRTLREVRVEPILVANDPAALTGALLCGQGLMLASDLTIRSHVELGSVRRILPGWTGQEVPCNAVFPHGRTQSPKVRAFVDFLVERLTFDSDRMHLLCPDARAKAARQAKADALARGLARAAEWNAAEIADEQDSRESSPQS